MTPWLEDPDVTLYHGDCLDVLRQLPDRSVHMCATSPPFFGLRDYGTGTWEGSDPDCDHVKPFDAAKVYASTGLNVARDPEKAQGNVGHRHTNAYGATCGKCAARRVDQQIGLEDTPDQWVERLVAVFREVRRVLRDDGTLWVEIGDSYAAQGGGGRDGGNMGQTTGVAAGQIYGGPRKPPCGFKPKDLLGQPWLLAFALRADGWYLRSEIIWARPNPMPESVTDRPTKSHSTVFLLSKQPRYFYDADAIRETHSPSTLHRWGGVPERKDGGSDYQALQPVMGNGETTMGANPAGANARSVWTIPTQPTPFAHFATWPEALVRRMILAGTSERGCCSECGAPWTRDTERSYEFTSRDGKADRKHIAGGDQIAGNGWVATPRRRDGKVQTLGWSPSCTHDTQPVPCTVLDPFAGSATTMLVARDHGRHSIGIELNADYLQIAARRLQQLTLLA